MSEQFYIDGYNVLHRSSEMRRLANQDLESAREKLIDQVAQYCAASGDRATLIFDGQGQLTEQQDAVRGVGGFSVVYVPGKTTADAWIERRVYQQTKKQGIVVVSGDRGITDLCIGMGSLAMTPDAFLKSISDHVDRNAARANALHSKSDGFGAMEETVDEETRERLARLRDQLNDDKP